MSDRAETRVRAWPMPPDEQITAAIGELIGDACGAIAELADVGRVLVIDCEGAAEGIHAYDDLIAALHALGLNVFAENLDCDTAIVARREFWPAGGDVRGWLIHPLTREPLVRFTELEAAIHDGADRHAVLDRFREPTLPEGLLHIDTLTARTPPVSDPANTP